MFNQEPRQNEKRKYLTQDEINRLLQATRHGETQHSRRMFDPDVFPSRFSGQRNLSIDAVGSESDRCQAIHVRRLKNGLTTTHPGLPVEIRLLENWLSLRQG
ncbi:hypothetical protein QRZ34_28970 [Klebsiella michiganensis]|nr:hypothetical protein [Klebsiella michiganensis]MDL4455018.1 hypothetical protein [Klebsiella michiganensis]